MAAGSIASALTGPNACRRGAPPRTGTTCAQGMRLNGSPAAVTASTSPDGVHPATLVLSSPQYVSRRVCPPSISASHTSGAPSRLLAHASSAPSRDSRGQLTGASFG